MVRSMMSQTDLLLSLWGYALETAMFTLNRVPTKSIKRTPYKIWFGKHPGLSFFKVWGCEAYVKQLISDKLTPKSDKCFFVGYLRETKGYYFYNKAEGKVFVARNDVFMEKSFSLKGFHVCDTLVSLLHLLSLYITLTVYLQYFVTYELGLV
jgi:hypothetical protein